MARTLGPVALLLLLLNGIVAQQGAVSHHQWYGLAWLTLPLLGLSLYYFNKA